jgi:PLP dependent protein
MSIGENLFAIRTRIAQAESAAARAPGQVVLVAVSKFQSLSAIREAYAAGQRDFGENYVPDLVEKRVALADLADIRWHFIGHLQSRKAKDLVIPNTHGPNTHLLVHGLDSRSAVQRLDAAAREAGQRLPVLLQINIGGETSKSGVSAAEAAALGQTLVDAQGLDWRGLMTIPPPASDPINAAAGFRRLRQLRDRLSVDFHLPLPELSMGMSDDFEAAIAEGATLVRVGTAIFGARPEP